MITTFVLFVVGLALLLGGGHALVVGASALARGLGVPPVVVGLTVVAFGTSAPELVVSLQAAWSGQVGIVFGNLIGSNIANIGLILGVAALIHPLHIESRILGREIPMMVLATVAVVVLAGDELLRDAPGGFDRSDGLVLLLFFGIFLYTAIGDVVRKRAGDPILQELAELPVVPTGAPPRTGRSVLLVLGGLGGLAVGGSLTVDSAAEGARALGVSEAVIGLTLVAIGTSLPELVTSVIAALRGEADLAVGNVIGSNIFNLLFVLGTTAVVRPVGVPPGGWWDLLAVTVFSLALLPLALTHQRRIVRTEGGALLLAWAAFTVWRFGAEG